MQKNPYQAAASYRDHAVTTASPARIVVLAFERLTLDLERALVALENGEHPHTHLIHAQELLMALLAGVDTNAWEHAHAAEPFIFPCVFNFTILIIAFCSVNTTVLAHLRRNRKVGLVKERILLL